ncbi:alpha-hydroxy-acid oxidizing protein [Dryocola sp. LX212]
MNYTRRNLIQFAGAGLTLAVVKPSAEAGMKPPVATGNIKAVNKDADDSKIISLDRLEQQAKEVMSPGAYAFISGASGAEWTLHENRRAFNDYPILTHRLADILEEDIDLSTELLGHQIPYPVICAPAGVHTFVHPEGELVSAKGVSDAGTIFQCSGASAKPLEAIAEASTGPKWFQLYFNADLGVTKDLLLRAKHSGYNAIILTTDALGPGSSEGFSSLGRPFPSGFTFGNHDPRFGGRGDFRNQKANLTPKDIEFVASVSGLPVIVKGIMRGKDADNAISAGAAAIQVSNHGGRQLDGLPAAISVLPEVANHVKKRVPIIFDSGIRRGIDVFRALCLGADAVAIGRPMLYGLSVGGAKGVQNVFEHLRDELRIAMLLAGCASTKNLSSDFLMNTMKNNT